MDFSFLYPKGIQKFKGQYFHSRQYKHPEGFEKKRILVIGIGNSASDIAVELCKKAAQVRCSLITLSAGGAEAGGGVGGWGGFGEERKREGHSRKSQPYNQGSIT